jgi:heme/copper-type cytochrome/quinol oxidase subunit 4
MREAYILVKNRNILILKKQYLMSWWCLTISFRLVILLTFLSLLLLITKRIFPMFKIKIPMALATLTLPTTIFFFFQGMGKMSRNKENIFY